MIVLQSNDRAELFRDLTREMNKYPSGGYTSGPLTRIAGGWWQISFWPPNDESWR